LPAILRNEEYAENAYSLLTDGVVNPTGPASGTERVVRGGVWNWDIPGPFSATFRNFFHPALMDQEIGFRCARAY
jgi:formylglycine-generating enzyme required for sulfatase activity